MFDGGSLSNCLIADNIATSSIGGVYSYYGGAIDNCTTPSVGSHCITNDPAFVSRGCESA